MAEMKSWLGMIDSNRKLLERKTGLDAGAWAERARGQGITSREALFSWLKAQGVAGYSAMAIEWELFGYPEYFLRSADELYESQYADRPNLRPIADRLLEWALTADGVEIQLRKTYASLQTGRRKFAQISPTNKTTVDLFFRVDIPDEPRLEPAKVRDDPFNRRIRLRTERDVDDAVFRALAIARDESL